MSKHSKASDFDGRGTDEPTSSECIVCHGVIMKAMRYHVPFVPLMDRKVGGDNGVRKVSVGYFCQDCGIMYRKLPAVSREPERGKRKK